MVFLKCKWEKLNGKLDEITKFSQQHYPNFKDMPEKLIRKLFETYKDTTFIYIDGQIQGFATFQEWPDCLNFIMIFLPGSESENLQTILGGRHLLPKGKRLVWWDEKKMKARGI